MALNESQKRATAKWDRENMITLGCKVKKEEAEAFKEFAASQGKTSNTVLKNFVYSCIAKKDGISTQEQFPQRKKSL